MPPERDPQSEIEKLERRYAEHPEGRMFAHLADAYRKVGELEQAERLILEGLERHPDYLSAHIVLGRVYLDEGRFDEARERFKVVLQMDPENLIALNALGDMALGAGVTEEARGWYERMLQVDPYNEDAQSALESLGASASQHAAPVSPDTEEEAAADVVGGEAAHGDAQDGGGDVLAAAEPAGSGTEETVDGDAVPDDLEAAGGEEEGERTGPTEPGDAMSGSGDAPRSGMPSGYRSPDPDRWNEIVPEVEEEPEDLPWERTLDFSEGTASGSSGGAESSFDEAGDEDGADGAVSDWASQMWGGPSPLQEQESDPAPPDDPEARAIEDGSDEVDGVEAEDAAEVAGRAEESSEMELDIEGMDEWRPGLVQEEYEAAESFDTQELLGGGREREGEEGLMTETMADLYARQGLLQQALKIYRDLAEVRPHDDQLRAKIHELEEELGETRTFEDALRTEVAEPEPSFEASAPEDTLEETSEPEEGFEEGIDEWSAEAPAETAPPADDPAEYTRVDGISEDEAAADRDDGIVPVGDVGMEAAVEPEDDSWSTPLGAADSQESGEAEIGFEFARPAPSGEDLERQDPFAASFEPREPEPAVEDAEETDREELPIAPAEDAIARAEAELESIDELATEEPVGAAAAAGYGEATAESEGRAAEESSAESIGEYLRTLVGFTPGDSVVDPRGEVHPKDSSDVPSSETPSPSGGSGDDASEDLEQFQDWLRSLKR